MSVPGPIWHITEPAQSYPDGRFDGAAIIPQPLPVYRTPAPLDPQQPTPEQIADAAREALTDIDTVIGLWTYEDFYPLFELKRLYLLLTPPAPKWTATEQPE